MYRQYDDHSFTFWVISLKSGIHFTLTGHINLDIQFSFEIFHLF